MKEITQTQTELRSIYYLHKHLIDLTDMDMLNSEDMTACIQLLRLGLVHVTGRIQTLVNRSTQENTVW